jgi:lipopolysaccharide/colanic/teichoic acid biosynthesis glycosyltransferase
MADRTELFRMLKFRSMYQDAEARSGAVWATKNDPRVTRVGLFLRKTRLDEIPQLINVLRGDMSLVGPRPERPGFYGKLERAIPFFADRTMGLRPGITGLAQVNQGYDTNLDDVRRKVTFDHAYAMRLAGTWSWLRLDLGIMVRTVTVMATGRGQ